MSTTTLAPSAPSTRRVDARFTGAVAPDGSSPAAPLADHLDRLAALTARDVASSSVLVAEAVALLLGAAAPHVDLGGLGPTGPVAPVDPVAPLIVHQRTAGHLAARTAGHGIVVDRVTADRLDVLWRLLDPAGVGADAPGR